MATRQEIETALDAGRLRLRQPDGNLWQVRRNGATQTWKTRPGEFRIPVKAGFKSYGSITHLNIDMSDLVIT